LGGNLENQSQIDKKINRKKMKPPKQLLPESLKNDWGLYNIGVGFY
jgi:hypothetical protein